MTDRYRIQFSCWTHFQAKTLANLIRDNISDLAHLEDLDQIEDWRTVSDANLDYPYEPSESPQVFLFLDVTEEQYWQYKDDLLFQGREAWMQITTIGGIGGNELSNVHQVVHYVISDLESDLPHPQDIIEEGDLYPC